jgi:hypothetical protein
VQARDTARLSWQRLRGTRWSPPTAATGDPERRLTYGFAPEQAEQMLRAAAMVSVAAWPLLVFYGVPLHNSRQVL